MAAWVHGRHLRDFQKKRLGPALHNRPKLRLRPAGRGCRRAPEVISRLLGWSTPAATAGGRRNIFARPCSRRTGLVQAAGRLHGRHMRGTHQEVPNLQQAAAAPTSHRPASSSAHQMLLPRGRAAPLSRPRGGRCVGSKSGGDGMLGQCSGEVRQHRDSRIGFGRLKQMRVLWCCQPGLITYPPPQGGSVRIGADLPPPQVMTQPWVSPLGGRGGSVWVSRSRAHFGALGA
jgi:hypothetical protein